MLATAIFLVGAVVAFGLLFLRIHMLPDHIAHRGRKAQFEIVAVLGLISMVTGIHAFWIAALLLALVDIPDFTGPLRRIAGASERIAGLRRGGDTTDAPLPAREAATVEADTWPHSAQDAPTRRNR
nr:hypothetical protein [uncultured Roseococcus sp.]